jgi:AAA15 family ATPase/GTPase
MITTLEISNFKSIKHLKQDCKRINIFIGEPNTGKSNILEAFGLFSFGCYFSYGSLAAFVRFERTSNLFYDENLDEVIELKFDNKFLKIRFKDGAFRGECTEAESRLFEWTGNYSSLDVSILTDKGREQLSPFKFYRFAVKREFPRPESEFLLPPSGENLLSLLVTHRELRNTANQLFSNFGLRLGLRPQENKIEVVKQLEDIIISYPYSLTSDTLQRLVFYLTAVFSNKNSVLVFEEPESHAFPYYTKYLAETIALDKRDNQYFISTHNPYFLLPLLAKCPKEDIAITITYYKDYQTKIKSLNREDMEEIAEIDVFSNIDRFIERQ